jgi:nitronate monooxygenase
LSIQSVLGIKYPIIQAGMAGGITTPSLVAAVSNFGALGTIGAGYMNFEELKKCIVDTKTSTPKPFGVNLFVPEKIQSISESDISTMINYVNQFLIEKKLFNASQLSNQGVNAFEEQLEIILEEKVAVCSFTFGLPDVYIVKELKKRDVKVIGTATTVSEAVQLEDAGVDYIVAQGSEAGGHRGTFSTTVGEPLIGTIALVPQMINQVKTPVIAAGGIINGRGVMAALALGAVGAQLGSVFLTCHESGAAEVYKDKVIESDEESAVLTKAFSGKLARGINNEFIKSVSRTALKIPAYPIQNNLTKSLRTQAAAEANPEMMSLWAGQGLGMINNKYTVEELLYELVTDLKVSYREMIDLKLDT